MVMVTGPPPKFPGTRDILQKGRPVHDDPVGCRFTGPPSPVNEPSEADTLTA
ncbi:hypothetical protein [Rhodococcus marinonascens]|uniref:hypothetical protein n=1 Tax=Rhodococcus marinonascens TaxID=38311 RepID=UPI000A900753|nr:hypothetical protein [Rhodococcus marinonascens]